MLNHSPAHILSVGFHAAGALNLKEMRTGNNLRVTHTHRRNSLALFPLTESETTTKNSQSWSVK